MAKLADLYRKGGGIVAHYAKKEHLFRCSLVRETGLEPYSVEHKPIGNTAFSNVCVMICVMSVF